MKKAWKANLTVLCVLSALTAGVCSCGDAAQPAVTPSETNMPSEETTEAVTETVEADLYHDDLGTLDFGGAEFRIWTMENFNVISYIDVEKQTGDVFDDSLYTRNRKIEDRANVKIVETINPDNAAPVRQTITAGDDAFDVANLRCPDALTFYSENLIYSIAEVPNLDLTKPYWAQKLNKSITVGGSQYTAIGSFDISVLDLTYALAFNKQMIADFDFESPYQLVADGKWTIDKMNAMMMEVTDDMNGDGKMDAEDRWGVFCKSEAGPARFLDRRRRNEYPQGRKRQSVYQFDLGTVRFRI